MDNKITLTLDGKQMDIIANALGMRPYVEVAQVIQDIGQQVQAQQQPQTGPQTPEKANGAVQPQLQ